MERAQAPEGRIKTQESEGLETRTDDDWQKNRTLLTHHLPAAADKYNQLKK